MTSMDRAMEAGTRSETEMIAKSKLLTREQLEHEVAFLAGQSAYLSMRLTEIEGNPSRDCYDALDCLRDLPMEHLVSFAADPNPAKFLELADAHKGNIIRGLLLLQKISIGLSKAAQ